METKSKCFFLYRFSLNFLFPFIINRTNEWRIIEFKLLGTYINLNQLVLLASKWRRAQKESYSTNSTPLLCDYLEHSLVCSVIFYSVKTKASSFVLRWFHESICRLWACVCMCMRVGWCSTWWPTSTYSREWGDVSLRLESIERHARTRTHPRQSRSRINNLFADVLFDVASIFVCSPAQWSQSIQFG